MPQFRIPLKLTALLKIPANRWIHLTHRRLQAHPSTLTSSNTLLASPLPTYLTSPTLSHIANLGIFDKTPHGAPNHVLINEYKPGEGIMPHEDGDAYASVVATVSLGGGLCLDVVPKPSNKAPSKQESGEETGGEEEKKEQNDESGWQLPTRIFQEPRSLLITTGAAYRELMHGISAIEVDENLREGTVANWALLGDREILEEAGGRNVRETRVSLTYRDVLKVSLAASKVFGRLGRR
jgi:alkylated DNA repair protein alkB family protein 6